MEENVEMSPALREAIRIEKENLYNLYVKGFYYEGPDSREILDIVGQLTPEELEIAGEEYLKYEKELLEAEKKRRSP